MRHQKKRHKLGRSASHRKATLAALATALIKHKRIETTLAKAKALRVYVEPLITRSKEDTTHNRREVFRHLQDKYAVTELFNEVSAQVGDRPGGYTRVVKLGLRQGDSAEMAVIELVDWNDVQPEGTTTKRRTRRGGGRGRRSSGQGSTPKAPSASGSVATGSQGSESTQPPAQGTSTEMHDAPAAPPNPEINEHPDTPQGASPGTGEPPPETGKGDQGTSGGSRHRG